MDRLERHELGFAAAQMVLPDYTIYSRFYWPMHNRLLSLLINPCPSYSQGFLGYSSNTKIKLDERFLLIWPLFCEYKKKDKKEDNGLLRITQDQLKNALNDFYLHYNYSSSAENSLPYIKGRFVIICKTEDHYMVSTPIKISHIVSWFSHAETGYDSPTLAKIYRDTQIDKRVVVPGHLFNKLQTEGVPAYVDSDNSIVLPFDMCSELDRSRNKFTDKYIYSRHNIISSNLMLTKINNNKERIKIHSGVYGNPETKVKKLLTVRIDHDERKKIYHEVSQLADIPSCIKYIRTNYPQFTLFPTYEWGYVKTLSNTFKGLLL